MLSFCLKSRKDTENKNPKVPTTKNRRIINQNIQWVIVKNQNILKSKKLENY